MGGKLLKILKDRDEAKKLLVKYYCKDVNDYGKNDKLGLLRRCNRLYLPLVSDGFFERLRNYEIESRLDEARGDTIHRIVQLCPFNGFNMLDDDGTFKGFKDGDTIPSRTLEEMIS